MGDLRRSRRILETASLPTVRWVSRLVFDTYVTGTSNIPRDGGFVLAANHFSHLDPPLIDTFSDRIVRFLAVDDLFGKSKLFDRTMDFLDAIPLDRNGYPVAALHTAIDHITDGHGLGLFPEGRRVERWGLDDPKRGAAWLAWMTGAPLIPVAIHGTQMSLSPLERAFKRSAVRIWYEEPLWWHDYVDRPDPVGSMTADWFDTVDRRLSDWMEL